ncbi:hypothetical protein VTJ49DRAFT_6150 [Mycothermus thermophilus]|uniref:RNA binding protein Nrd1 n=1 Tax=Humicola insolens TaxID=85995 RepID=A0ABR3V2M6_HUMIN
MASSVVAELEAGLQAMAALKPPGVSGSRITNITALCVANVQYESVIIQKLFTHFKKTPGTHKLGVLYVVDSVTRKWLDQAKAQGQTPSLSAPDGTFAAGVHRVTELIPILMNDIIATAPEDQKEKIKKLVDIWEKGQTFPPSMVNTFKEKLNAPRQNESTTPPGSPPRNLLASLGVGSKPPAPPPPPASSVVPNIILDKLASIARQNASSAQSNPNLTAPAPASAPAPVPAATTPAAPSSATAYGAVGGPVGSGAAQPAPVPYGAQPTMPYLPTSQPPAQPVNAPGLPYAYPAAVPPAPVAAPGAISPPPAAQPAASNPAAATVQLVAALAAQGIPIDKIAGVIQMMTQSGAIPSGPAAAAPAAPQMPQPTQTGYTAAAPPGPPGPAPWEPPRPDDARDRPGVYHDGTRSPNRARGRSRSRSPGRWDGRLSPRSRANERGGYDYGGRPDDRGRRGGPMPEYRQRSPHGRHSDGSRELPPPQLEKWIEYDNSLPNGHIKVYSRTLFVGGVTCTEPELREIFNRFGQVQTCIVNREKRHAFVKMYSRKDAERAKERMEDMRNPEFQLRTRWGVGFGPRDCSDYQTGISVIPIHKLTEADRKWMLTAPYGGSGGRPIVTGLCVEEPDIEIGAGVSSKAISRRMQTDKSGNHGPKSTRPHKGEGDESGGPGSGGGGGRWRHKEKHRDQRRSGGGGGGGGDERGNSHDGGRGGKDDEPIVMDLPAGITMGPNGINYPPNFAFGAAANP